MWEEQLQIVLDTNEQALYDDWKITYEAETNDPSLRDVLIETLVFLVSGYALPDFFEEGPGHARSHSFSNHGTFFRISSSSSRTSYIYYTSDLGSYPNIVNIKNLSKNWSDSRNIRSKRIRIGDHNNSRNYYNFYENTETVGSVSFTKANACYSKSVSRTKSSFVSNELIDSSKLKRR